MNQISQIETDNTLMLDELIELHPQLTEKAIVDYINGLEVIDDQIKISQGITRSDSFLSKVLCVLTGKDQQRQLLINENVGISLEVISVWLQELEHYRIENDVQITFLANKLYEIGQKLKHYQFNNAARVSEIDLRLEELKSQMSEKLAKLDERVQHEEAINHLTRVFKKWNREIWNSYPPLVRLCLSIDELYWGNFGRYCRKSSDSQEVNQLIEDLHNEALEKIEQEINIKRYELFEIAEWLQPVCNLSEGQREALSYLCDWAMAKTAPVTWSIQSYASSNDLPCVDREIPIVLSAQRAVERLIYEYRKRP
jgi:YjcZ-like protein